MPANISTFLFALLLTSVSVSAQKLAPHTLSVGADRQITLSLPAPLTIGVALTGLHRPRFFAASPDHRIFVTDLYSLADNNRGAIFILDGWNDATHTFTRAVPYLQDLRNPNNLAFYTDPATHQTWLYTALTDRLVRFKYIPGDTAPTSPPELLARYPDYGLSYKYGGWHLTRTIAFATLHGHTRLFISVGSSCNACQEKEPIRASLQMMDPDGSHHGTVARGLRNAVGLAFLPTVDGGSLFATNMGADHLGDHAPEDQFFELDANNQPGPLATAVNWNFTNYLDPDLNGNTPPHGGNEYLPIATNYGWPTCFFENGTPHPDALVSAPKPSDHIFPPPPAGPPPAQVDCAKVPAAYTTFAAHSSPLGLAYFDGANSQLKDTFLVALHGAGHARIGTGYRVVRFSPGSRHPQNFLLGFLVDEAGKAVVKGRPCGILQTGPDSFLLTDDFLGVIYAVHPMH